MTAKASVSLFQGRPGAAFPRLFMTRTTLWRKCDAFVQVRVASLQLSTARTESFLGRCCWSVTMGEIMSWCFLLQQWYRGIGMTEHD